ncbi:MAG: caspase family protein [Leptospiraceae bacterium]|nr:caspase family protein [Leptospiraceae bacterium]
MKPFRKSFSFLLLLLALSSYGDNVPVPVTMGLKPIVTGTGARIAFLVGINSYKATTSLKYAVGDSDSIEDLLLKTGKYDKLIKLNDYGKITTTLNPDTLSYSSQRIKMAPTKLNIESTYQEILAANPETLLFYYSGHGFIEGEGEKTLSLQKM